MELPKKLRLPKRTEAISQQTTSGVLIKQAPDIPPLREWPALFAKADTSPEPELNGWDITLHDGLEDQQAPV